MFYIFSERTAILSYFMISFYDKYVLNIHASTQTWYQWSGVDHCSVVQGLLILRMVFWHALKCSHIWLFVWRLSFIYLFAWKAIMQATYTILFKSLSVWNQIILLRNIVLLVLYKRLSTLYYVGRPKGPIYLSSTEMSYHLPVCGCCFEFTGALFMTRSSHADL